MSKLIRLSVFAILVFSFSPVMGQKPNPEYDSTLARKLGADERGMKMYVLAVLKTGPNKMAPGPLRDSLFRGHFSNMSRLAGEGSLVLAGPFDANDNSYRGLFLFNVPTIEEARELVKSDPTIRERIFDVDFYGWYGSAAISEYMAFDRKLTKTLR